LCFRYEGEKLKGLYDGNGVAYFTGGHMYEVFVNGLLTFPRCMECQRGLAMRKVSVCPSVHLSICRSNECIVTKQKKDLSRFLYHTKDHLAWCSEKKNGWWGLPLLPEILGQRSPLECLSHNIVAKKSSINANEKSAVCF